MISASSRFCFFDAFGTLIYPEPRAVEVYHRLGLRHGDLRSEAEIGQLFRQQLKEIFGRQTNLVTSPQIELERWRTFVQRIYGRLPQWQTLFDELWEYFSRPQHWKLFDDVSESLMNLKRAGVTLGIASNFDGRLRSIIKGLPPLDELSWVFLSAEIGWRKPAPEFFRFIGERCKCPPSALWMVGDDWNLDAWPASACGWNAVHVDRKQVTPARQSSDRVTCIRSLRELAEIVLT